MFADIPSELAREILLRLPSKTLLRFRCVCTEWQTIIDDLDFAVAQANRQMDMLMIKCTGSKLYTLSLSSLVSDSKTNRIEVINVKNVLRRGVPRILEFPISSCHGLILITDPLSHNPYTLWNPFTGDWLAIPRYVITANCDRDVMVCAGFGYDVVTQDYKLVRVSKPVPGGEYTTRTLVYSMKSGQWRRIEDLHNCLCPRRPGVFANGALHWIINFKAGKHDHLEVKKCVSAFDLAKETYRQIPLPSGAATRMSGVEYPPVMYLDEVSGCLFLTRFYQINCFGVWILKDCDMWDELIKFDDQSGNSSFKISSIRPVAYMKSEKQVVLEYNKSRFLWYDVEKNIGKKISFDEGIQKRFSSQVFPQSLIRLDTLTGTSNRKRKRERANMNRLNEKLELETWWCWEWDPSKKLV